ncbi:MAG: hypothetical protein ACO3LT_01440 [Ilumatobacteraceae bacterium]
MSYMERSVFTESCFAQVYNTANWSYTSTPNTLTETWLTSSGNGAIFSGGGYVFGFLQATASSYAMGSVELGSANEARFTHGQYLDIAQSSSTRTHCDDQVINYGTSLQHYQGVVYFTFWGTYLNTSRFNVIRMES